MRNRDKRIQVEFGTLLRKIRLERRWSQGDLAAAVNMESNAISRLENGVISPNLNTLVALAIALGKQPADLVKLDLAFELNDNFSVRAGKEKRAETTATVRSLTETGYFATPRSVSDVIAQCKKLYRISLKSPATSGALNKLRDQRLIKRTASSVKGRYLYYKEK